MRNTRKKLLAILFSVIMLISAMPISLAVTVAADRSGAENRVVYVSTDGSDSTGNGTEGNPYATLSKAMIEIEADDAAYAGTIIISGDNAGAGIAFTAAAHTKMITVEGISSSIVIAGSSNTKYKDTCGPLTIDNVKLKNLGLNPHGYQLVLKDGITFDALTDIHTGKTETGNSTGTVSGVDVYIDAYQHSEYRNALYLTVGKDDAYTVNGDVNVYINNMYSQGLDIEKGTYNGNVNLTVNNYHKSSNGGDDIYYRNNGTVRISGALQVVLNNGVTTGKYKTYFRDGGPSGRTWLLYGETAADGTILEMSDTVGVYNVKGGMTANAYKVTTSTSDFATDTLSETAVTSNDGVLDLRESGAGEYVIRYTYHKTVYVSTAGSDSTGDGTVENPYASLSKAMIEIEADDAAYAGTIIISGDNAGAGIGFTSAAHTKMITIEGITSSILIDASNSGTWRQTQGPLTFDNISVKRLGLEPRGHELVIKEGVILEGVGGDRLNVHAGYNTSNGDTVYMGAHRHDTYTKDVYMYIGNGTVTGDLNVYIDDIYAKSVDLRNATYNGNVNLTVNNYRKSSNSGDDIWIGTGPSISGALQVILNNDVRNIYKANFRDRGPSGRTWLLYGETAVDGTILEMSDTVGVYTVKGGMTANAYKVTTSTSDFATDTVSETAITSNDGILDLREAGAGEYYIHYTPVAFKTHSLVLTDAIGVNFHMDLGGLTEQEKAASYMTFAIDKQATEQRVDFADAFTSGGNYGFTCFISSVQMAESVTPTFHYGTGETVTGVPFSAKDYIDYVVANSSFPSTVVDLVKSLGDYGHYAQIYLGGRNGWTAGTQYTALAKYRAADYDSGDYNTKLSALSSAAVDKEIDGTAVTGLSYSLNFDSNTYVNVELKTDDSVFASATVDGKLLYVSASGKLRTQGLSILQLGEPITITGKGSSNINTFAVTLSGLSYVRAILNSGSTSAAAKNAVSALYDYYQAARAYKGLS